MGGGGQPYGATDAIRRQRAAGLHSDDVGACNRCSHHNPLIRQLYAEFLGEPLGEKAHRLLHTHYKSRQLYVK